jgi:hypothetical protein
VPYLGRASDYQQQGFSGFLASKEIVSIEEDKEGFAPRPAPSSS